MHYAYGAPSLENGTITRTGSLRRLVAAFAQFICGSDEIPVLFRRKSPPPVADRSWTVSAGLLCRTPFGSLSSRASWRVSAASEAEAISLALAEIRGSYPGYSVVSVTANQNPRR